MSDNQQHRFHHDFETYSEVDLRNVGGDVYARHPSTEPLMLAYATDDLDIDIWVPAEGQEMPTRVRQIIADRKHTKFACLLFARLAGQSGQNSRNRRGQTKRRTRQSPD